MKKITEDNDGRLLTALWLRRVSTHEVEYDVWDRKILKNNDRLDQLEKNLKMMSLNCRIDALWKEY